LGIWGGARSRGPLLPPPSRKGRRRIRAQ
jgi:hypothetical protein